MPKKKSTHVCSGCDREFEKLHSLSTHRNLCPKLREDLQITAKKEPTKKKKSRKLLKRILSQNSQATSEKSITIVLLFFNYQTFMTEKTLQLFEPDETPQEDSTSQNLPDIPEPKPPQPSPPSFIPPPTRSGRARKFPAIFKDFLPNSTYCQRLYIQSHLTFYLSMPKNSLRLILVLRQNLTSLVYFECTHANRITNLTMT
jgi:hypothetical protein